MEPEFAKAADELIVHQITLGKVDCTQEDELVERFKIKEVPTLKIFYKNKVYPYLGPRHHKEMIEYMIKHL